MSIVLRFHIDSLWQFVTKCDNFISKCDSSYKMQCLLQITLFNLIIGGEVVREWSILRKNFNPFVLFPFINTPPPLLKWSFLCIPPTPSYYLLAHPSPFETKLKHTGVDMYVFFYFSRCRIFANKIKKCFWKSLMGKFQHLSWSFLQKKLLAFNRRQFLYKIPPWIFDRVLNNTNSYFDESYSSKY